MGHDHHGAGAETGAQDADGDQDDDEDESMSGEDASNEVDAITEQLPVTWLRLAIVVNFYQKIGYHY